MVAVIINTFRFYVNCAQGLFSSLEFPYAQFPCANLTGDLLFDPLWEAIARLERCALKVLAVTADGASPNRRFLKIHEAKGSKGVTYKVKNPYATDGKNVFFLSDPTPYEDCEHSN